MQPTEKVFDKIKWRDHEMILAGLLLILYTASLWWNIHDLSAKEIDAKYGSNFLPHMPFSYYRNVLLPGVLRVALPFLFLLTVNRILIPRWVKQKRNRQSSPEKKFPGTFHQLVKGTFHLRIGIKKTLEGFRAISLRKAIRRILAPVLLAACCLAFFVFFIGVGWAVSFYLEQEYLFHYPGFQFLTRRGYWPQPQIGLNSVILLALKFILLYVVYAGLRELIIWLIGIPDHRRAYRVFIVNQVTGFLVALVVIAATASAFEILPPGRIYALYFSCLPPAFFVFMTNVWWIFPAKGERSFFSPTVLTRLLTYSLLYTLVFFIPLASYEGPSTLLLIWVLMFLAVTPVSWILYRHRKDRVVRLRGLEKALGRSKADLQFLRSQINPHFLFNTLNTLYGTALQEQASRTADGVQKLGDMMRFMLHDNNRDLILMSSEIEYLHNYIYLQKLRIRSSDSILIEDNIPRDHCDHMIAPMLLIPFVENAFKHGISLRERSWIMIDLHCDEKNVRLRIRNSIHERSEQDPERNQSGVGMKNVVGRLKLLYPGKFDLGITEDSGEYRVELSIQP